MLNGRKSTKRSTLEPETRHGTSGSTTTPTRACSGGSFTALASDATPRAGGEPRRPPRACTASRLRCSHLPLPLPGLYRRLSVSIYSYPVPPHHSTHNSQPPSPNAIGASLTSSCRVPTQACFLLSISSTPNELEHAQTPFVQLINDPLLKWAQPLPRTRPSATRPPGSSR
jgi:hypothetical protein